MHLFVCVEFGAQYDGRKTGTMFPRIRIRGSNKEYYVSILRHLRYTVCKNNEICGILEAENFIQLPYSSYVAPMTFSYYTENDAEGVDVWLKSPNYGERDVATGMAIPKENFALCVEGTMEEVCTL